MLLILKYFFLTLSAFLAGFVSGIPLTANVEANLTAIESENEAFSAAPNNTPISKVYIFGKPVYIREPFVIPQRDIGGSEEEMDVAKLFDESKRRNRSPSYASEAVVAPAPRHRSHDVKFPLKQCYTERSGFMCCNRKLENVMHETAHKLRGIKCNLQKVSTMLQKHTQQAFGTDFETLTGTGDFASKIHFYSDYVCKMERDGRVLLAYGTPNRHNYTVPYTL
uniref:Ground-like domain-containing protein n=1 Tax=Caenorhabditis japonica TaxID=281687 RepID=A0A8R1DPD4_CAEJA